jgi:hypothetical protein
MIEVPLEWLGLVKLAGQVGTLAGVAGRFRQEGLGIKPRVG